jgi:hypothetical protein
VLMYVKKVINLDARQKIDEEILILGASLTVGSIC